MTHKVEPPKDEVRDKIFIKVQNFISAVNNNPETSNYIFSEDQEEIKNLEYEILALIKLQQEALLSKVETELPKVMERPEHGGFYDHEVAKIDGFNAAIEQVKTAINKLRLEL